MYYAARRTTNSLPYRRTTKAQSLCGLRDVVNSRKIGNNTFEITYENGDRAIRLHYTDVVTTHPDGSYTLDSGGWDTVTTKQRMNQYSNASVWQEGYTWYAQSTGYPAQKFYDGMKFDFNGKLIPKERR